MNHASAIQGYFPRGLAAPPPLAASLQRKPLGAAPPPAAIQRFGDTRVIPVPAVMPGLPCGGGQKMPMALQRKMESFFNTSFADVQIHVGPHAASIGALAFTLGSTIHFAPGQYNPGSPQGEQLLGHELAHVVQQKAGRVRNPLGSSLAIVQDAALEADADRLGRLAAGHRAAPAPINQLQMKPASHPGAPPVYKVAQAKGKDCGCGCTKSGAKSSGGCGGGAPGKPHSHPAPVQRKLAAPPAAPVHPAGNVIMRATGVIQRSCTKKREAELESNVHYWCDQPRSCKNTWDCGELKTRLSINQKCLAARTAMKTECYPVTDSGHQEQFDDIKGSISLCSTYISQTTGCA